jgi:hypothetical protein
MGIIIRLTEQDLDRIVKRVIREEQTNVNVFDPYFIDNYSIYTSQGNGNTYWTTRGTQVWLNQNEAQTSWPAGDAVKTKKAAQKLVNATSGIDISGSGAKLAQEVATEWKTYSLIDQNEFLRQWYKLGNHGYVSTQVYNPWIVLLDDFENDIATQMINHSKESVKTYCQPYVDKKNKEAKGTGKPSTSTDVICDLFVTRTHKLWHKGVVYIK